MAPTHPPRQFHPTPVIGHPEQWYKHHIEQAEAAGDSLARCAYKTGQYVTLGLDPKRPWDEKAKYFRHCLKHHCVAGAEASPDEIAFRQKLRATVLRYAGQEGLRVAREAHLNFKMRKEMGTSSEVISEEADDLFVALLGDSGSCAEFFTPEVHAEIRALRDRWI